MNHTRAMCALLVCAAPGVVAQAADETTAMRPGWQFGAGIGQSDLHIPGGFQVVAPSGQAAMVPSSDHLHAFGYQVFAGYRITRYFAVEGSYLDGGSLGWTYTVPTHPAIKPPLEVSFDAHPHAGALSAMGILPLSQTFSLFGRAGDAHWWYNAQIDATGLGKATAAEHSNNFIWGAGAFVYVDGGLLRAEYEQMKVNTSLFGAPEGRWRLITLSVVWML